MTATADTLRRELVRNVARSLLDGEVEAAGGTSYPWVLARAELPESTRIRVGRRGDVVDANLVQIRAVFDKWAQGGNKGQIAISLWDEVLPESLVAQADRPLDDDTISTVANALRVITHRPSRSVSDQIGLLRLEAQENIGPDTAALSAVLEAFDRVLEAYAIGWRAHVDMLEAPHVTGFSREAGAPVRAIREALLELVMSAADKQAADASFALSYWPVHVLRLSVGWRAPAYFEFLDVFPFLYRRVKGTQAGFQERLLDRSWIHLVEFLELMAPTLRPPYVVDSDDVLLARAEQRARQALWEVLRAAVQANDVKTAKEALRRWRIAEERGSRSAPARIAIGLPMLWEAIRRVTAGQLEGGSTWLRIAAGEARFESVLSAFGELLDPDIREIDLDDWDSWDRPSHEVHRIDSNSDLVRATLLLMGLLLGPSTPLRPVDLTRAMYELRDTVEQVAREMIASAPQHERVYDLESLAPKLEGFLAAWGQAVDRYERAERDRIRNTRLDQAAVDAFAAAVATTWSSGHPRSLLLSNGAVVAPRTKIGQLALRELAEKRFFTAQPENSGLAAEIGGLHGEALLRGELNAMVERLRRLRGRTYGLATLTERLERAIDELNRRTGHVVLLIPHSWEMRQALIAEGRFQPSVGDEHVVGRFGDVDSYDLGMDSLDWVAVIAFPGGVVVEQDREPSATVETIDASQARSLAGSGVDPGGDASETVEERFAMHVIIDARERLRVSVDPKFARRVLVPGAGK